MAARFLIITLGLLGIMFLQISDARATSLGLADGNYNVTIDLPNTANDGTGTISIGANVVTSFHFTDPLGQWDCGSPSCAFGSSNPDFIEENNSSLFMILDSAAPGQSGIDLELDQGGVARVFSTSGLSLIGSWSATSVVPEPTSIMLLGSGMLALYFGRRRQS